jgi:Tol biopolymer transport system component
MFLFVAFGCSTDNNPVNPAGFKGYIYYSNGGEISRIRLSDETVEKLFTNASQPDITEDGRILAIASPPIEKIIYSDHSGANRQSLIESESYTGPKYKYMFDKPRISFNQAYVAYEGDNVINPVTYVIDANDGSLVATIGDYDANQPMISPSWAPDGSLYVQGWTSMNNGIYKVAADFSSMERIDPNLSNVSSPSVSPDGQKIAFIRDGKIWTMGLDGSNPSMLNTEISNFRMPTWSPDSKYLAVTSSGSIFIIDFAALTVTDLSKCYSGDGQLCWRY